MYASTPTKLDLPTWARIMGLNPLHFGQVQLDQPDHGPQCDQPWIQNEWQGADSASREEIARCIAEAEAAIEAQLGYRLLPTWEPNEWHASQRGNIPELFNVTNTDIRGFSQAVKATWGQFITGGVRAQSLIVAAEAIAYSAPDPAGWAKFATITFDDEAIDGLDPCEVHAYYPGHAGDAAFEIRPIRSSVAGTILTVQINRELLVIEEAIEDWDPRGVDGTDDANFLVELDLYRVYNDPSTQGQMLWENIPGSCNCGTITCATCQYGSQAACLTARGEPRNGMIGYWPAEWNADTFGFYPRACAMPRQPDGIRLNYYAGLRDLALPCPTLTMTRDWQIRVARFATALLDRPPCACASELWNRWAQDLAASGGAEELELYNVTASDLGNPFGTRRGMVYAWKKVAQDPGAANAQFAWVP